MVTESIAAPLYAPLADRFGRRTVFVPLVGLWGVSALIFGFAHSPWSTVVLRGACAFTPPSQAIHVDGTSGYACWRRCHFADHVRRALR